MKTATHTMEDWRKQQAFALQQDEKQLCAQLDDLKHGIATLEKFLAEGGPAALAQLVASQAGGAGPIGSQWEKMVAQATKCVVGRQHLIMTQLVDEA